MWWTLSLFESNGFFSEHGRYNVAPTRYQPVVRADQKTNSYVVHMMVCDTPVIIRDDYEQHSISPNTRFISF